MQTGCRLPGLFHCSFARCDAQAGRELTTAAKKGEVGRATGFAVRTAQGPAGLTREGYLFQCHELDEDCQSEECHHELSSHV